MLADREGGSQRAARSPPPQELHERQEAVPEAPQHRRVHVLSGDHQGGFSKGGFSNLCVIVMFVLLNPSLLNPTL